MPDLSEALVERRDGVLISLEVSAAARSDAFPAGYNEWRRSIGCRVSAPAVGGRANKAVLHLVAATLGIPYSSVSLHAGATSSQKLVHVTGVTRQEILEVLTACLK